MVEGMIDLLKERISTRKGTEIAKRQNNRGST